MTSPQNAAPGYFKTSDMNKEVPAVAKMAPDSPQREGLWLRNPATPASRRQYALQRGPAHIRTGRYGASRPLPDLSQRPAWWQTVASMAQSMPRPGSHAFTPWVGVTPHPAAGIHPRGQPSVHAPGIQQLLPMLQQTLPHIV